MKLQSVLVQITERSSLPLIYFRTSIHSEETLWVGPILDEMRSDSVAQSSPCTDRRAAYQSRSISAHPNKASWRASIEVRIRIHLAESSPSSSGRTDARMSSITVPRDCLASSWWSLLKRDFIVLSSPTPKMKFLHCLFAAGGSLEGVICHSTMCSLPAGRPLAM